MRDEDLPGQSAAKGARLLSQLQDLAAKHELIGEARGIGLMLGLELVTDKRTKAPAKAQAAEVKRLCREAGVIIGVGGHLANVLRIQPPLVISNDDLDHVVEVLDGALTHVARA